MHGQLMAPDQVAAAIREGRRLLLAGDERIMTWLPAGDWIGGSVPYVVTSDGAQRTNRSIYVDEMPDSARELRIVTYTSTSIANLYQDAPRNGFTILIMPAKSKTLLRFALDASKFSGFGSHPVIGWISGVDIAEVGRLSARIFNGLNPTPLADGAVAMHVELPPRLHAELGIVNIFSPQDGDSLRFPQDGFAAIEAVINGKTVRFAEHLTQIRHDLRLPLITKYGDALINVSFDRIDRETNKVHFHKPVFADTDYYLAKPIGDYSLAFRQGIADIEPDALCFNCILNYQYGCLAGQNVSPITFPCTYGEIAHQLLNQTLVHLRVRKHGQPIE